MWELVSWTGMNIDELTPDVVRDGFVNGTKASGTAAVWGGQIVFAKLSTQPETIYVLKIQKSSMNTAIVHYASVSSTTSWPLGSASDADAAACVANVRKLGVYAAVYAEGHGGMMPSNFAQLRSVSPEPLELSCPGNLPEGISLQFGTLDHESSYVIIAPGVNARDQKSFGKIFAGCLKHGFVSMTDGSGNSCQDFKNEFMREYLSLTTTSKATNSPIK